MKVTKLIEHLNNVVKAGHGDAEVALQTSIAPMLLHKADIAMAVGIGKVLVLYPHEEKKFQPPKGNLNG